MAQTQSNNNRIVMILAAAVVVLFIAFIAVVLLNTGKGGTNTASNTGTTGATNTGTTTTATSNPGVGSSAAFDPSTATKVPSNLDPKSFTVAYYQNILDKKWQAAFDMQPAASKQGNTVDQFKQTEEQMYGMTSFKLVKADITATDATVVINQELGSNGTWNATWTFTKVNGTWLVKGRKVGMGAAQ